MMLSVSEALSRALALCPPPKTETVPIRAAHKRVLAQDIIANRDQPPFNASAMDGYAMRRADLALGASLKVIGEAAAGDAFAGEITKGTAVRIFTGGAVPSGADMVLMQENTAPEGSSISIAQMPSSGTHIRAKGADFKIGDIFPAPRRLNASDIGLLASMNIPMVPVSKKPVVAIIATGDELVLPGQQPKPAQIICSNNYAVGAVLEAQGATVRLLPIARDNSDSLRQVFSLVEGADMVVTIGGASVGDYDLINPMAKELGLALDFYKIAMRPGKPLIAGKFGKIPMIGLPGNPVSSMVCAQVFLRPMIDRLLGLDATALPRQPCALTTAIGKNGPREHYMRANVLQGKCTVSGNQDSGVMTVMAHSNALLVRAPFAQELPAGAMVECILL